MLRNLIIWIIIATVLASLFNSQSLRFGVRQSVTNLDYSELVKQVQNDQVRDHPRP